MSTSEGENEENNEGFGGYVGSKSNVEGGSASGSTANRSQKTPVSWAVQQEYEVPIYDPDDMSGRISSPPRLGTQRTKKRKGTPNSKASFDDFSLPPELPPEQDTSFKGWLASGILDTLNAAAGITLATTGQIIAPPLQLTKSVLFPALLALFVDTMDAVTPPRVKDWMRIISASFYHLFSVLTTTEKGQTFTKQFVLVLQDLLQALSSPETRQVLVDGMASTVKLAEALHTPEMQAWFEQLSILGCRLLDAAASGKSKQLLHDTKDLAWKGIETATDPATTLALAEVTAHLCHALEDAQESLNPTPRAVRNAQNQATYLDPLQMSDYPQYLSMEEIILSCLGKDEETTMDPEEQDAFSIPSNVVWNEEQTATAESEQGWKDRKEKVDTEYLRERILSRRRQQQRVENQISAISSAKSSVASTGLPADPLPTIPSNENGEKSQPGNENEGRVQPRYDTDISKKEIQTSKGKDDDIEDFEFDQIPKEAKRSKIRAREGNLTKTQSEDLPASQQFYRVLDDMLAQNRSKRDVLRDFDKDRGGLDAFKLLRAKVNKLKNLNKPKSRARGQRGFQRFSLRQKVVIALGAIVIGCLFCVCLAFSAYGAYKFLEGSSTLRTLSRGKSTPIPSERSIPHISSGNTEVVIRVIREVVHVREDGSVIESILDQPRPLSEEEIEKATECIATVVQ